MEAVRINKFLATAGVCSRREADRMIESGRVKIDGITAKLGDTVAGGLVTVDGRAVKNKEKTVLLALNKPVGIECTTAKNVKDNIVSFVNYGTRIYPVGRLDKNSCGLILMTNDGSIVNDIMKSSMNHEKEYIVEVDKPIDGDFIKRMGAGIHLRDTRNGKVILDCVTKRCEVVKLSEKRFKIILTQGLNRQIRRMCQALGYSVVSLERVRIMNITLAGLKTGEYRLVTPEEYRELREIISKGKVADGGQRKNKQINRADGNSK